MLNSLARLGATLLVSMVVAACNGDSSTSPAACDLAGSDQFAARVNGETFCAVTVFDAPIIPGYRQIGGLSADGRMLHLIIPLTVGNHPLATGEGIGGSFLPDVEGRTTYLSAEDGWIVITERSATRVRGSFEFTAQGFDQQTAEPTGTQVSVTDGRFDVPLNTQ